MSKKTILVVDDEPGFLRILQIILKKAGYNVQTANHAPAAFDIIKDTLPDLIIMDDNMPHMSGAEACQRLKNNPITRHIPIVMYSAGMRIQDANFVQHIGADAALKKPAMPDEIIRTVAQHLTAQANV